MSSDKLQIILASASPRREDLLREMGLQFTVVRPIDVEELLGGAAPDVVAMQNAQRKARAVAGRHPDSVVIGADTIVVLDGKLFGKPRDLEDATQMIGQLAGQRHEVVTGVCLLHRALDTELTFAETTRVWMRPLTHPQIAEYLGKMNPLDNASANNNYAENWQKTHGFLSWAGAYAIQHGDIIEQIEGSYSNVMGLPVEKLRATLERLGILGLGGG
ncbi:MAG TPA: Maf family protein [Verrucomicrobiae bacterium]|nr:Maf family protein [Verrucomicrobiae bacterium]